MFDGFCFFFIYNVFLYIMFLKGLKCAYVKKKKSYKDCFLENVIFALRTVDFDLSSSRGEGSQRRTRGSSWEGKECSQRKKKSWQ